MSKIKKYRALNRKERALFREALFLIYYSKFLLIFFRFKRIVHWFRKTGRVINDHNDIIEIKLAIARANKVVPWKKTCLVNTLTARKMLNKRSINSTAYLGVMRNENDELIAHAWIVSGEVEIIPKGENYTELHSF